MCVVSLLLNISKSNALNWCLKWKMLTMNALLVISYFSMHEIKILHGSICANAKSFHKTYECLYVCWHARMHNTAALHSLHVHNSNFCIMYSVCVVSYLCGNNGRFAFLCDLCEMARYVHIKSVHRGPAVFLYVNVMVCWEPLPFAVTLPSSRTL